MRPQLDGKGISREDISYALRNFTDGDEHPVFWGYFPAYDWVALVGLFGALEELPFHFPQLCLDIKQWAIELGDPELPHQKESRHHALADARWTKEAWAFLASLHPPGAHRRSNWTQKPRPVCRPTASPFPPAGEGPRLKAELTELAAVDPVAYGREKRACANFGWVDRSRRSAMGSLTKPYRVTPSRRASRSKPA